MVKRARLRKAGRELAEEATRVLSKELADQQQGGGTQAVRSPHLHEHTSCTHGARPRP